MNRKETRQGRMVRKCELLKEGLKELDKLVPMSGETRELFRGSMVNFFMIRALRNVEQRRERDLDRLIECFDIVRRFVLQITGVAPPTNENDKSLRYSDLPRDLRAWWQRVDWISLK